MPTSPDAHQLEMPELPEMVLKVRALLDNPDTPISQLERLLSGDLAISLYLIEAANSVVFSKGRPVDNLHDAISRLDNQTLYSIVVNIALTNLFQANTPRVNNKLKEVLARSRMLAANCYVLAQKTKYLQPGDAMLAGLLHEIGVLSLCLYADRCYPEIEQGSLEILIKAYSAPLGFALLKNWNFPEELIDVVTDQIDLRHRPQTMMADFVDVVTLANFLMQKASMDFEYKIILAAERIGCSPEDCKNFYMVNEEKIAAVNDILGVDSVQAA